MRADPYRYKDFASSVFFLFSNLTGTWLAFSDGTLHVHSLYGTIVMLRFITLSYHIPFTKAIFG